MVWPPYKRKTAISFLAVPVVWLTAGLAVSEAGGWRTRFYIGPPQDPEALAAYEAWRHSAVPPDSQLPPLDSYSWPTLRQALDQYGWFGRKACSHPQSGNLSPLSVAPVPDNELPRAPYAHPEQLPPPHPWNNSAATGRPQ
jgi:hypothetical protein